MTVLKIKLPPLPAKVDFKHLADQNNGLLITADNAGKLEELLKNEGPGRFSKKQIKKLWDLKYPETPLLRHWGIIKHSNGDLHAVYLGRKHGKHLGKGGFGKVKLAQNIKNGKWSALKVIKQKYRTSEVAEIEAANELNILKAVDQSAGELIKRGTKHNFLMELINGATLDNYIKDDRLPAIRKLDILLHIMQGVQALHNYNLVHCDIKPNNSMYDFKNNKAVVIDVGLALEADNPDLHSPRGTPGHTAPEIDWLMETPIQYTKKIDIFALGLLARETLILTSKKSSDLSNSFSEDEELKKLIASMTDEDPAKRPELTDVMPKLIALRKELLPVFPSIKGIVDFNDFKKAKNKSAFIAALKSVDMVIIADDTSRQPLEYIEFRKLLEKNGIAVDDEIHVSTKPSEIVDEVRNQDREKKAEVHISQICYFKPLEKAVAPLKINGVLTIPVTTAKENYRLAIKNSMTLVTQMHIEQVVAILTNELLRLEKTYGPTDDVKTNESSLSINMSPRIIDEKHKKRADLIRNKINDIRSNPPTYTDLFSKLRTLENSLLNLQSARFRYFTGFFKKNTASIVRNVSKDIKDNPIRLPKMKP